MKALAATTPHLKYIDLNPVLFDAKGEPRVEPYRPDGLHFFPPAYDLFTAIIKPVLTQAWQQMSPRPAEAMDSCGAPPHTPARSLAGPPPPLARSTASYGGPP